MAKLTMLSINIMTVSEIRWIDSGQCTVEDHKIYYSRNPNSEHINGVELILNNKTAKYVANFTLISECIILVQLEYRPIKTNIVQVRPHS